MKLLIAVDDLEGGKYIVDFCKAYLGNPDATVVLATVIPSLVAYTSLAVIPETVAEMRKNAHDDARNLLLSLSHYLQSFNEDLQIEEMVLEGMPADAIIRAASDMAAHMIAVGSHGKRGLRKVLLGSVSQAILAHSTCSVVICNFSNMPQENTRKKQILLKKTNYATAFGAEPELRSKCNCRASEQKPQSGHCDNALAGHWTHCSKQNGCKDHAKKALVAYVRQADAGISISEQCKIISDYCQKNGYYLKDLFTDYGQPSLGLQSAFTALGDADGLIASDLACFVEHREDRLRDLRPFVHQFFNNPSRRLIAVEEGIDTGNAIGQANALELINQVKETY